MLGDIGMAKQCLRRIETITKQKVDWDNIIALENSIQYWYHGKQIEERLNPSPRRKLPEFPS